MAIIEQKVTDKYAVYNGDCMDVMKHIKDNTIHFSIYSPPFAGLYVYSSDIRDLSNSIDKDEFFKHYEFVLDEIYRITMFGRMTCVHCTDIPTGNSGLDHLVDLSGDFIRLYEKHGFEYVARRHIWKEPLTVRNRTMTKALSHKCITLDSTRSSIANADFLLTFRRKGPPNPVPVTHSQGLTYYAGPQENIPSQVQSYKNWKGSQLENRYSHWIWRQYASCNWYDVRLDRVLPYRASKEQDDERHCHPLQLDVIERCIELYCNPNEIVFTPFMGVGSEIYGAIKMKRRGIGVELKPSYYKQAIKNIEFAIKEGMEEADQKWMEFNGDPISEEISISESI